ncbi:MAG: primosomal protein [Planctomycetota bacterium]
MARRADGTGLFGPEDADGAAPNAGANPVGHAASAPASLEHGVVHVAVERGVDRYPDGLSYAVPPALADLREGERVTVPLGRGGSLVDGYVVQRGGVELLGSLDPSRVKPVHARDDAAMPLPGQLLALGRWISAYYGAPIGVTLANMVPSAVRRRVGSVTRRSWILVQDSSREGRFSAQQRAIIACLEAAGTELDEAMLLERAGVATREPLRGLARRGIVRAIERTEVQASWADAAVGTLAVPDLTDEQRAAVDAVATSANAGFSQHLLFGVTGSGKTEVYLQLIERTLARGRSAILLVPEIALTPQTSGRVMARLSQHRVLVLHSGLTAAQRHEQWGLSAQAGPCVVVGARSAIFAPIPDGELGLVIVDEEHDTGYKQDQQPRYHGRDTAIRRAHLAGCPILLGSATPSLETWWNATERGTVSLHRLTRRAPGLRTPRVELVDFRAEQRAWSDRRVHLVGPTLERALRRTLDEGGQAIILLNRRGYANSIVCAAKGCDWCMECDRCDAGMVAHRDTRLPKGGFVRCHHCLSELRLPERCPVCRGPISIFGLGTQRVEEELERTFPDLPAGALARVDGDTTQTAAHFHDVLGRFGRGDVRILLGTQMIAKGLDFPNVRVVGVISADTALNLPDFRATERTYQLVSQVAGRCGRGDAAGLAIVQTFQPDAPAIQWAASQDFEAFAASELAARAAFGLPPTKRLARIVVRDADHDRALSAGRAVVQRLLTLPSAAGVLIRPAADCPIARINDRFRVQIELLAPTASALQQLIAAGRSCGAIVPSDHLAVDVDPVALL